MKKILLRVFGSKYFPWILLIVLLIVAFKFNECNSKAYSKKLDTYKRQLTGQLSDKEQELQKAHHEKGILQSELLDREELIKRMNKDKEETDQEFEKFKEKHDLEIRSRDKTIARLEQKTDGGKTEVVVISENIEECKNLDKCVVSYNWQDNLERFKLQDPNIFEDNNETFESKQIFKIYGEIHEQKDSSLQIRRLTLREVFKDENGEFKPIPGAKADIIDSKFEYVNAPYIEEWKWQDLFRLRSMFVGGFEIFPNTGNTKFGLGLEFFTFRRIGIGSYTTLDFKQPELMSQNISLQYNPTIINTELNLGAFISIGTPFTEFFDNYQLNTGFVFYLNN